MTTSFAENRPLAFIITAAGSGTRMGQGIKKEFRNLNGKPVLAVVLENFLATGLFSSGVITCKPGSEEEVKGMLYRTVDIPEALGNNIFFCGGGKERQQSVMNGLNCLENGYPELLDSGMVLIHDGARPWASPELIKAVAKSTAEHSACAPVIPSVDAMKEVNADGIITGHLPRKETVGVQTPQGFTFSEIINAHRRAAADGRHYIDDTEIFSRYEGDVYTVEGLLENRKITYSSDLEEGKNTGNMR